MKLEVNKATGIFTDINNKEDKKNGLDDDKKTAGNPNNELKNSKIDEQLLKGEKEYETDFEDYEYDADLVDKNMVVMKHGDEDLVEDEASLII